MPEKVEKIYGVIEMLKQEKPLPKEYKAHQLIGNYKGVHGVPESDLLLIWWIKEKGVIKLVRLGSHSKLFNS